jgi:hypothetical protein
MQNVYSEEWNNSLDSGATFRQPGKRIRFPILLARYHLQASEAVNTLLATPNNNA